MTPEERKVLMEVAEVLALSSHWAGGCEPTWTYLAERCDASYEKLTALLATEPEKNEGRACFELGARDYEQDKLNEKWRQIKRDAEAYRALKDRPVDGLIEKIWAAHKLSAYGFIRTVDIVEILREHSAQKGEGVSLKVCADAVPEYEPACESFESYQENAAMSVLDAAGVKYHED